MPRTASSSICMYSSKPSAATCPDCSSPSRLPAPRISRSRSAIFTPEPSSVKSDSAVSRWAASAVRAAEAAQRLTALSDFTELGSGVKIALRDLEIRGAGNLLGDEQSGHVAALGFELYMQMLDEAVRGMRRDGADDEVEPVRLDVDVDAYVPA